MFGLGQSSPGHQYNCGNMLLYQLLTATWSLRLVSPLVAYRHQLLSAASTPRIKPLGRPSGGRPGPRLLRERQVALKLRDERCYQSDDAASPTFEKWSPLLK